VELVVGECGPEHHVGGKLECGFEARREHMQGRLRGIPRCVSLQAGAEQFGLVGDLHGAAAARALAEELRGKLGTAGAVWIIEAGAGAHDDAHIDDGQLATLYDEDLDAIAEGVLLDGRQHGLARWRQGGLDSTG
jgi:hypothetical protein